MPACFSANLISTHTNTIDLERRMFRRRQSSSCGMLDFMSADKRPFSRFLHPAIGHVSFASVRCMNSLQVFLGRAIDAASEPLKTCLRMCGQPFCCSILFPSGVLSCPFFALEYGTDTSSGLVLLGLPTSSTCHRWFLLLLLDAAIPPLPRPPSYLRKLSGSDFDGEALSSRSSRLLVE